MKAKTYNILIVDDERDICRALEFLLTREGINEDVKMTVRRLLEHKKVLMENIALRQQLSQHFGCKEFIGVSPQINKVFEVLEKVIPTRSNILILGESGTGKGVIAEVVHCNSQRKDKPFISINCSAIPENLLESELFGYRKGAFTGAASDKKGLITMADQGTLFLDEIGDMPIGLQAKILKVLESGEVMPVGDTKATFADVRLIAATNKNIEEQIKKGLFREDLYYRLNVIEVTVPPLRERREDIAALARHFTEKFSKENNKKVIDIADETMELLYGYSWPGNIRELRNVMERAVVLAGSDRIMPEDLPHKIRDQQGFKSLVTLKDRLDHYEEKIIKDSLRVNDWNKEATSQELGVDLATLYRKIKKLGISDN
ncbi:MAG: sigma-54-dependent Fis family transcriptional regulator [Nitrospirae bacterium]|nr:sigma-54-dependent Fis family transcriptional regulator [Nitrospirota bacterium]